MLLSGWGRPSFRLAQAAEQIDAFLTRELDAGRLGHDRGDDPVPAVTAAHDALGRASEQAADLGDSFRRAASALAPIQGLDADERLSLDSHTAVNPKDQEAAQVAARK
ncbi:Uncharacterised protein [Mycobacterium tuberculosis]|nr:Uncharacterised protein [Mycobacterium tuberculosis]